MPGAGVKREVKLKKLPKHSPSSKSTRMLMTTLVMHGGGEMKTPLRTNQTAMPQDGLQLHRLPPSKEK